MWVWLKSTVEKESLANVNSAHSGAAKKKTKTKKQNLKQIYRKYTENSLIKKWHIVLYFYR